jgi:Ca-activated chloride channel homolog
MVFASPWFLLLLVALPLLAVWEWRRARRDPETLRFSDTAAATSVRPTVWVRMRYLPAALRLAAVALAIIAMARPQQRDVLVERSAQGIDIVMVMDLSTSMLARDFNPNRLEAARAVASRFVDGRVSDRIGIVVFAGRAYTMAPLTLDYAFLKTMLESIRTGTMEDGTAIGTGLATAVAGLRQSDAESRVIILLTDGQNNRGEIDPMTAAEIAYMYGIRIYSIGIGSDGVDAFGRSLPPHLRQLMPADDGVDAASLTALSERTGGRYFHADDERMLETVYDEISTLERSEIRETTFLDVQERYAAFLWPAFLLVLVEVLLTTTRLRRVP